MGWIADARAGVAKAARLICDAADAWSVVPTGGSMESTEIIINIAVGVVLGVLGTTTIFNPRWLKGKPWYIWMAVIYVLLACVGWIAKERGLRMKLF